MKHTYIKIYNQARQEVGLPGPSPEEAAAAEAQALAIIDQARDFTGGILADGNPNAPNYQTSPFWKFPYNCAPDSNPWLYPISAENGLFFTDLTGPDFSFEDSPCGGGEEMPG